MYITNKQEEFSRAYVSAIAAPLGFNVGNFRVDNDSIDIAFTAKYEKTSKIRNPQINLQLKCTKTVFKNDNHLHYPLSRKNYDDLRGNRRSVPCYLVVVCVPEIENDWVEIKQDEMLLRYSAYWYSLRDAPDTDNKSSITIKIPKTQKIDKNTFKMLMDKASEGIAL